MATTLELVRAVNNALTPKEADQILNEACMTYREKLIFMSGQYDEKIDIPEQDEAIKNVYWRILSKTVKSHNSDRIKMIMDIATDFKVVDKFLGRLGLKTLSEKISTLKELYGVDVVGHENDPPDEATYQCMVNAIISYKFKGKGVL